MDNFCRSKNNARWLWLCSVVFWMLMIMALRLPEAGAAEASGGLTKLVVETTPLTEIYAAMGTIRPLTESNIHSQISAKVIEVLVAPGDKVGPGELLIKLDNREVVSRLEQAREGLAIAKRGVEQALRGSEEVQAEFAQAESEYNRSVKLFKEGIHSRKEFDQAKTRYLKLKAQTGILKERLASAKAGLRQAEQVVTEAEIYVEYAEIRAFSAGVVTKREVDPGDLATPNVTLLTLQTGANLRLEAGVRESLIGKVEIGKPLEVMVGANNTLLRGIVEEVEPYADAKTRSFQVKVSLPAVPGVFPGMFGRLLIPLDTVEAILIPREAVTVIGQLQYVEVLQDQNVQKVFVKTGKLKGSKVEIVSGLKSGDTIVY